MKRISLVLDKRVLEEARRLLGAKTYSAAVNTALTEIIRQKKVESFSQFFGSGLWDGDLAEMRRDRPRHTSRTRRAR